MTVKELKSKLADLNDEVRIDTIINLRYPGNDKYDISATMCLTRTDVGNEDGYVELVVYPHIEDFGVSEQEERKNDLIFDLGNYKIEFKSENEINDDGTPYFTWYEAMRQYIEPDEDGWRLPTKEELEVLRKVPYKLKDKKGIFDNRLELPAAGYHDDCDCYMFNGSDGYYWSASYSNSYGAYGLYFNSDNVYPSYSNLRYNGQSVRLVRKIK